MNEEHHSSLKQYVNDVIALERDIANAVQIQIADEATGNHAGLRGILHDIVSGSEERMVLLKALSDDEGGSFGASQKEGITAVTGVLAGLYSKVREHPVSRMVRDDLIAMDVSATSYGMLLTLGLATGHPRCVELATKGLGASTPLVMRLSEILPAVVCDELAKDAPLADLSAATTAQARIRAAWSSDS